eukprot:9820081-Alexandrium_andersonii.AAC.1
MEVRLSCVDEESLPGPAAATGNSAPPSCSQVGQEESQCLKGGRRRKRRIIFVVGDVLRDVPA